MCFPCRILGDFFLGPIGGIGETRVFIGGNGGTQGNSLVISFFTTCNNKTITLDLWSC